MKSTNITSVFCVSPELWLTRMMQTPIDGDTSIIVFTTHKQLSGKTIPRAALVSRMQKFDRLSLLKFAATLGLTLECDRGSYSTEYQIRLAEQLLPPYLFNSYKFHEDLRAVLAKARNRKFSVSPLITPLHVLNFLKQVIVNHVGKIESSDNYLLSRDEAREAFSLLLAFGDHLESSAATPLDFAEESKQAIKELTRATILLSSEPAKRLIGRYFRMCFEVSTEVDKSPELKVFAALFEHATGLSLAKYFSIGLATLCKFSNVSLLKASNQEYQPISEQITLNWNLFFDATALSADEKRISKTAFCESLSKTRKAFTDSIDSSELSKSEKSFEYDLLPLIQKPLIELESNSAIPAHLPFILEKFTSNLYWPVADSLETAMKGHFTQYWGNITQRYVEEIFKTDLIPFSNIKRSAIFYDPKYNLRGAERRGSDIIIYDHKLAELFLFEVTYSGLRLEAGSLQDNLQALSFGMDKLIDKARQLNTVINDLRSRDLSLADIDISKVKRFRPFVITLQPYPLWNFLWQSYPSVWDGLYGLIPFW